MGAYPYPLRCQTLFELTGGCHRGERKRRDFLKTAGAGAGAAVVSSLFHDSLLAGTVPKPGRRRIPQLPRSVS